MDFPAASAFGFGAGLSVMTTASLNCPAGAAAAAVRTLPSSAAAWPSDGRAIYVPFRIMKPFLVVKMAINNVVQDTGPFVVDVGLLNALRVKLTSSGRTNQGGVGPQIFDVTDVLLTPGTYFYAMYGDTDATPTENVSRMALTVQTCQACGVQQEAVGSGSSLPAIATFAGGVVGNSYVPYIAIAGKTTF